MSLIEQAAKRLEQLRQAGVEVSDDPIPKEPVESVSVIDADPRRLETPASSFATSPVEPVASSRYVALDLDAIAASGFISPHVPRSCLADQYRVIKRPLIENATGKDAATVPYGNLIMVTSALPREGKTFTAINLAMSIAMELDNTVMLVDADVARPSILNALGLPPTEGLLDLIVDDSVELSKVILRTNVEKLSILPGGTPHPRATELLASESMATLLDDLAKRYSDRIIIFDSPPLLMATEARVLASRMGQIVFVVQAETTPRIDVQHALTAIENCPVKLMVFNQARAFVRDSYGYGYGYGYGNAN